MIPFAPKHFRREQYCYLKTVGSRIKNEGSLKLEKAILRFLAQNVNRQQKITVERS